MSPGRRGPRTKMTPRVTKPEPAPVVTIEVLPEVMERAREVMRPGQRLIIKSATEVLVVNEGNA